MQFWLSYNNNKEKLQLPVNPAEFRISQGKLNKSISIVDLGEVNIIGGMGLAEMQIDSFFPVTYAPFCSAKTILKPYDCVAKIKKWQNSDDPIRLIVTETKINIPVTIESFEYGERGGSRDVYYSLKLKEYRFINITSKNAKNASISSKKVNRPTKTITKTYTTKSGDTLWLIAKKVTGDGDNWRDIYNKNKSLIGSNPNNVPVGIKLVII